MADRGLFGEERFVIFRRVFHDLSVHVLDDCVLLLSPYEEIWLFDNFRSPSCLPLSFRWLNPDFA